MSLRTGLLDRIKPPLRSATIATWLSQSVKLANHATVLPLALSKLSVEEGSLWLLLYSFVAIGMLADFGFGPTFIRFIGYSSGKPVMQEGRERAWRHGLGEVVAAMRYVYAVLASVCFMSMAILGSAAMARPISLIQSQLEGWMAWGFVVVGTTAAVYSTMYSSFLQGCDRIALFRQWEASAGIASLGITLVALISSDHLVVFVAALQIAPIASLLVNRTLARRNGLDAVEQVPRLGFRAQVIQEVWKPAWRSGFGLAASVGVPQLTNVVLAQFVQPVALAPYLLAQRLIAAVVGYASAPFYTGIPRFVQLLMADSCSQLLAEARKRFLATNWLLVAGLASLGLMGPWLLRLIGSSTDFVAANVWLVMSIAAILDRTGAMHLQLYSLTNHILWHVANGVTGILALLLAIPLYVKFGILGVALGFAIASACFYVPFCLRKSYVEYKLAPSTMDVIGAVIPACVLTIVLVLRIK